MARAFDVVVWGASGFTGRLVCEQLTRNYQGKGVRWAIAGRNKEKLEEVRKDLAQYDARVEEVPILIASLDSPASLEAVAAQTHALLSTAGPYAQIGTPVVEACVKGGCHYCDLTAEIPWMLEMIRKFGDEAKRKNICIVHSCGFDSIPADLTAFMVVDFIKQQLKGTPGHLDVVVADMNGQASGGTIASIAGVFFEQPKEVVQEVCQPYCLDPPGSSHGPDPPDTWTAQWIPATREWAAPAVMQFINSPTVRKSAALLNYGPHFGYREAQRIPVPYLAIIIAAIMRFIGWLLTFEFIRRIFFKVFHPQGSGPPRAVMEGGFWRVEAHALTHEAPGVPPRTIMAEAGDRHGDAGYLSTSRMIVEAALCLALQGKERRAAGLATGGFPTPAAAMGHLLLERLRNAGLYFNMLSVDGKPLTQVGT